MYTEVVYIKAVSARFDTGLYNSTCIYTTVYVHPSLQFHGHGVTVKRYLLSNSECVAYIYMHTYTCIHNTAVSGLVTMNDPLERGFCVYGSGKGNVYQPLSVMQQFYEKHTLPLAKDPVFKVDVMVRVCMYACLYASACMCMCHDRCHVHVFIYSFKHTFT
jgi:hypothetical protein